MADRGRPEGGIPGASADHARHDLALIASHATGDAEPADATGAEALLADCTECRTVAADIRAVRRATRALPAPERRADFRLTPDQAARLRPTSALARLAAGLLAPRGFGRQLSGALMTLGVAGLLVAALPGLGAATQTARDAVLSAGGPASNYSAPEAATAGDASKQGGSGQPHGSPGAVALPASSLPADRGPAAAPSAAGLVPEAVPPGGATVAGASDATADRVDGSVRSNGAALLELVPALAAGSGLALLAGLGLYLLRRRSALRR